MLNLSQQDYVRRIEELNYALITAWDQDQRVKALKIAIQVGISLLCLVEICSIEKKMSDLECHMPVFTYLFIYLPLYLFTHLFICYLFFFFLYFTVC